MHVRTTQGPALDRNVPNSPRPVQGPTPAWVGAAAALAAIGLAPLAVAILGLFPPLEPASVGAGWLPVMAGGAAASAAGAAFVTGAAAGIRSGSVRMLARATAMGVLGAGLATAAIGAATAPAAYPAPALAICALPAGGLLLIGRLVPPRLSVGGRSVAAALVMFGVIEATLAVALVVDPGETWSGGLTIVAAALALASVAPGGWLAAGLVAAGLASLAMARTGTLEVVAGTVSVVAGCIGFAIAILPAAGGDPVRARPDAREELDALGNPQIVAPAGESAVTSIADEATRLARELRGTIAELLDARRTVELQRAEIRRLATIDPLTGLATRAAILDRLRVEAAEARRYRHPVTLLLLDIDGFSALNRDHGMGAGDDVLREVALRLRLRLRAADALGRAGGDSFLALLPHTDEAGAGTFADALRRRVTFRPISTRSGEVGVTVSIGVAFMRPGMELTDDELLAETDTALAAARAAGGNGIAFDRRHGLVRFGRREQVEPSGPGLVEREDGTT